MSTAVVAQVDLRLCGARRPLWIFALCALAAPMAACSQTPDIDLPAEWVDAATGEESAVVFRADGTGTFTEFPLWNGDECKKEDVTPYSGEFHWDAVDGYFRVDAPNGPMSFQHDVDFGHADWGTLVVSICGADTPDDEVLIYHGTFPIDY